MTFTEASTHLSRGEPVYRTSWSRGKYLSHRGNKDIYVHYPRVSPTLWHPTPEDLGATDWQVYSGTC